MNPITHIRLTFVAFLICLALAPVASFAGDDLPRDIAARLSSKWLVAAEQIRTPEQVIYYHGSATGRTAPDGKRWAGMIEGEILVLTPSMANACSKVRLGPEGGISIQGKGQMKVVDKTPPWKKLLKNTNGRKLN